MFHCACRAARHRIQHERKAVRSRLAYKMEHERVPDVQQLANMRRASGLRTRIHRRRIEWIGIVSQETGNSSAERLKRSGVNDLTAINGRRDQLEGKLQERYGWAKDQVRKDVDDWLGTM
jgi:hypothetical protein